MKVLVLLLAVASDSLIYSAPVEHRLEDVLIFDRDPDSQPGANAVEASDPTKRIHIPAVSEDDAEVISISPCFGKTNLIYISLDLVCV